MFKTGRKYRHRSCLDIDFIVEKILGENEEIVSFIVTYWNRAGFPAAARMQAVSVRKDQLQKWSEMSVGVREAEEA